MTLHTPQTHTPTSFSAQDKSSGEIALHSADPCAFQEFNEFKVKQKLVHLEACQLILLTMNYSLVN